MVCMGVDIHIFVEAYNKEKKAWEYKTLYRKDCDKFEDVCEILDGRDYKLFGRLAGVRSAVSPFVKPRGLPDDLSDEVKNEYGNGEGYFCETWYDYCELNLYADTDKAFEEEEEHWIAAKKYTTDRYNVVRPFVDKIDMILDAYGVYYPKPGEVRIVMWFDC